MPILRRAYDSDGKRVDPSSKGAILQLRIPYTSGQERSAEISAEIMNITNTHNHSANISYRRRLEEARKRMPRDVSADVLYTRMGW